MMILTNIMNYNKKTNCVECDMSSFFFKFYRVADLSWIRLICLISYDTKVFLFIFIRYLHTKNDKYNIKP